MKSVVALIRCPDYHGDTVQAAVRRACDLLGGIQGLVKPGSKVLVKPNLLMAKGPEAGITTHPEVVRAVCRMLKEAGCTAMVGDGPSVWGNQAQDIHDVYKKTGMQRIADEEGLALIPFERRRWRGKFPLTTVLDEVDALVSVPKFKTHELTILTGAVKNLFGLVSGTFKTELHKRHFERSDFSRTLVDIFETVGPHLVVVDGILALEGDGPATGGQKRWTRVLVAGNDPVAVDAVLARLMGIAPRDILTTSIAADRKLGVADLDQISVVGDSLESCTDVPFKLPATAAHHKIPRPIIDLARSMLKFYPCVEQIHCIRCASCVQACPQKIITLRAHGIHIDYSRCISCFCCQEACPSSAIRVKKSLFARLLGF